MSITKKTLLGVRKVKSLISSSTFKFLFVTFSAFFLFLGTFNAYAQESPGLNPDWTGIKTAFNELSGAEPDEDNTNSSLGIQMTNWVWGGIQIAAPSLTEHGAQAMANPDVPADMKYGLLGIATNLQTAAYANYPMVDVGEHLAQNWVPGYNESTTSTYAAPALSSYESGYDSLVNSGVMPLWTKMLNVSYVFFVIIMIVAGFMIMFRHKIGGQTMVTIGNVLPNIIMALVIATFSFAIAGLIIDIGGILVYMIADLLDGEQGNIGNMLDLFKTTFIGGNDIIGSVKNTFTSFDLGNPLVIGGIAALLGPLGVGMGVISLILALLLIGVVLVGVVKVTIMLYKTYFSLLLNVILAPIQITLGALPGNKHMITNWFLSVLRDVLVFPIVFFIINLPSSLEAANTDLEMNFPGKLTYGDAPSEFGIPIGTLFFFIFKVLVLYFAAQAPKFLEAWFPPNTPKPVGEGLAQAKASLSKIPVFGGLFK